MRFDFNTLQHLSSTQRKTTRWKDSIQQPALLSVYCCWRSRFSCFLWNCFVLPRAVPPHRARGLQNSCDVREYLLISQTILHLASSNRLLPRSQPDGLKPRRREMSNGKVAHLSPFPNDSAHTYARCRYWFCWCCTLCRILAIWFCYCYCGPFSAGGKAEHLLGGRIEWCSRTPYGWIWKGIAVREQLSRFGSLRSLALSLLLAQPRQRHMGETSVCGQPLSGLGRQELLSILARFEKGTRTTYLVLLPFVCCFSRPLFDSFDVLAHRFFLSCLF